MQSCFHLDLALKLKGINIAMGGGGGRALRLLFRSGNRVLGGRGEISTDCFTSVLLDGIFVFWVETLHIYQFYCELPR